MPRSLVFALGLFALASTVVFVPTAAALRPIDDFEVGPFLFQTTGAYQEHDVPVALYQGHLYTTPRQVILEPSTSSSFVSTQLALTGGDDAAEVLFVGGGRVRFAYEWSVPFDVTENGLYDRVEVAYDFVTPGAYFSFGIGDQSAFCGVERFPGVGPGVVSWPLDFCDDLVDPTAATAMVVYCSSGGSDDAIFEITDVRLMRSGAVVADIEREFVATMVPPVPSPPLSWITEVSQQPLFHADLVFENVDNGGYVPEMAADLQQESFHDGQIARSTATWLDFVEPGNVDFLLAIDLNTAGGLTPEIVYPPDPIAGPVDFSVLTGVMLTDGGGIAQGTSMVRLTVTTNPAQDYDLTDVQATVTSSGGLTQNRLEIAFRMEANGPFDPSEPLFDLVWLADWEGDDLTGVGSPIGGEPAAFSLVALPSLTQASTRLRASRPFAAGETVEIYDVAGRLVRRLAPSIGAEAVVWDGRDRSGMPAASGTYFARWQGRSGPGAVARVVRIR